ncbi:OmpA family protein [Paracrocinitomix mangrovi]|uniref:OmpA family protein n=1 Tax=Paracrocinitomix mangrovi TaxID=2862509 RepID=UPI001C8E03B1|nr:OmpA family protein [Paracrocinitomix mangrovi]UKN00797.1 OmpA family protein [Paracrocinitomix mangrovi]
MKTLAILLLFFIGIGTYAQKKVTFTEEFKNNDNNWKLNNNSVESAKITNGVLTVKNNSNTGIFWTIEVPVDPHQDYSIEISISQTDGKKTSAGFGLVFGKNKDSEYHKFKLSSSKHWGLYSFKRGKEKVIKDWVPSMKINGMKKANILKVDKRGEDVIFYINGEGVYATKSFVFTGNEVGVFIDDLLTVEVEYLRITYQKRLLRLAEDARKDLEKENLGENVNSKYHESTPIISANGKKIYYSVQGDPTNHGSNDYDIWESTNINGVWQARKSIEGPLNNGGSNYPISITPDENTMMVSTVYRSNGSYLKEGVSISQKVNGKWGVPVEQKIEDYVNLAAYNNFCLTPDGKKMILSIETYDSYGDQDLYVSFKTGENTWSKPVNLGSQINTHGTDFSPFIAADGKTLYFSSKGHAGFGNADIYVSKRLDDTWTNWSPPLNLGKNINSPNWDGYFTISAQGDYAYLISYDNSLGKGDIFRVQVGESIKPEPVIMVYGQVLDAKTNLPINAEIEYEILATGEQAGEADATGDDGYKIVLPKGEFYGFQAKAEGYVPISEHFDAKELSEYAEKKVTLYMVPLESGQKIRLNNTFFDTGKSDLRDESISELTRIALIMKKNPELTFEISGHTDNVGSDATNKTLSESRAQAVFNYLIERGIKKERLTFIGYGETKPVDSNDTEDGRQNNRRVEIKIL